MSPAFGSRESGVELAGSDRPISAMASLGERQGGNRQSQASQQESRTRRTFLELPPVEYGVARLIQSPLPADQGSRLSSIDASSETEIGPGADHPVQHTMLRSSFSSESAAVESHADAEDGASVIFQTAQEARLKRPSLANHPGAGGSVIQLAKLARFIKDREMPDPEAKFEVSTGDLDDLPYSTTATAGQDDDDLFSTSLSYPPSRPTASNDRSLTGNAAALTLEDALMLNPVDHSAIPKRSPTVPASVGKRRKTRFVPLSVAGAAGRFRRDSIVSTPYPKLSSDAGGPSRRTVRSGSQAPNPVEFNLTIFARNRNRTISVPQFGSPEPTTKLWWNAKGLDDKKLVELARVEYASIQGKLRHYCGAKTATSVRVRFVRSNKSERFREPDSPLTGNRWSSYAESDFWSLWIDPSQGRGKRDWLDVLMNHTKTYGASRTFVLEIVEGYDAVRIVTAFLVITGLSLLAMFLWLFLGVDERDSGTVLLIVNRTQGHSLDETSKLVRGSPTAAFMFAIWILILGCIGTGAWMFIS